jgi:hypothetical protein
MHTDEWCRYAFNHLQCFDIETTSPAEGAHYGLKSDSEVHSHCELSMLALADLRRTKQLYFENDREAEARALQEATNVRTAVETMLHKNVCSSTAQDVTKEFIQSANYQVFKPRSGDDPSVVALVVSSAPAAASSDPAPFQVTRVHEIMKVGRRLFCDCAAQTVHGRPCRHTFAYNGGLVDVDDFAHFHTKKYLVSAYDGMYSGVCDRAEITRQLPEYIGMAESNNDGIEDRHDDDGGGDVVVSSKKRKCRAYSSCEREFKRILVKWGNHPSVLQRFTKAVSDIDANLGDVTGYAWGRGSSKPTPQGSRSKH